MQTNFRSWTWLSSGVGSLRSAITNRPGLPLRNSSYHRGTLVGWKKAAYQGATGFEHIERRLGYRLVADRLRIAQVVKPGGVLCVDRDGRYAIRVASEGIAFDQANGWNVLAEDEEIREL